MQGVRQSHLAVGEERIPGEDVRVPEREPTALELLYEPSLEGVVVADSVRFEDHQPSEDRVPEREEDDARQEHQGASVPRCVVCKGAPARGEVRPGGRISRSCRTASVGRLPRRRLRGLLTNRRHSDGLPSDDDHREPQRQSRPAEQRAFQRHCRLEDGVDRARWNAQVRRRSGEPAVQYALEDRQRKQQ